MVRRNKYLGLILGTLGAVAASCGGTSNGNDTGTGNDTVGTDAVADVPVQTHEYTFVLDQLTIDPNDSVDSTHTGFNLDNLYSGPTDANGCGRQDFFAMYDNDQNCPMVSTDMMGRCLTTPNTMGCRMTATGCQGGVDNALPTLAGLITSVVGMDVGMTLSDEVTQNKIALLVRIANISDPTDQAGAVDVFVYLAYPTFTTSCTSVQPNRTYQIASNSINTGGTTPNDGKFHFTGTLNAGRVTITPPGAMAMNFVLPLPPIRGAQINLPLHALQLRADVSSTGLARGTLGGWVAGTDLLGAVAAAAPEFVGSVEPIIAGVVDIQLNNVCYDNTVTPHAFGGLSLGLGLHAVPAVVDSMHPIADAQAAGTCGYTAPSDGGGGNG